MTSLLGRIVAFQLFQWPKFMCPCLSTICIYSAIHQCLIDDLDCLNQHTVASFFKKSLKFQVSSSNTPCTGLSCFMAITIASYKQQDFKVIEGSHYLQRGGGSLNYVGVKILHPLWMEGGQHFAPPSIGGVNIFLYINA